MKNKNISTKLQKQYNKLQSRIHKAIKSGKFSSYTAFKQQRLQTRLQRYALQLRQLAKGVAVCAALGVALPASAQYVPPGFLMHSGNANPIDGFWNMATLPEGGRVSTIPALTPTFYDIDGDGDKDMFAAEGNMYNDKRFHYHENTGTAQNPQFSLTPSTNPIPRNELLLTPNCVDIDNDGDLDCFSMHRVPYYDSVKLYYFRNDGSATPPNFTEVSGSANPLDSMNLYN